MPQFCFLIVGEYQFAEYGHCIAGGRSARASFVIGTFESVCSGLEDYDSWLTIRLPDGNAVTNNLTSVLVIDTTRSKNDSTTQTTYSQ